MTDQVFDEQQNVRETLETASSRMAALARNALEPPADVDVAQAWLERADVVSKLVESIPILDEHKQVAAFDWRLKQRR
jgi:hypothetical protein